MKILNLTQHVATPEQAAAGVVEPENKSSVQELLTFTELPSSAGIAARAASLANLAREEGAEIAMIGGAPYLMSALEEALGRVGIVPLYSFSERVSVDTPQPDGTVRKTAIFQHRGWVTPGTVP